MKYIGYYTLQADYQGEFTREQIELMLEMDFLKYMNERKDLHPSQINHEFGTLLKSFPENKSIWIIKTLNLLEKHQDRWPASHYEVLHTYLIAVLDLSPVMEGNAAEIVRQRAGYISKERKKRKLLDILSDLSFWYGVPENNLKQALKRLPKK
jgi:hypothetical protein